MKRKTFGLLAMITAAILFGSVGCSYHNDHGGHGYDGHYHHDDH